MLVEEREIGLDDSIRGYWLGQCHLQYLYMLNTQLDNKNYAAWYTARQQNLGKHKSLTKVLIMSQLSIVLQFGNSIVGKWIIKLIRYTKGTSDYYI